MRAWWPRDVLAVLLLAQPLAAQGASASRVGAGIHRIFGSGVTQELIRIDTTDVYRLIRHDTLLGYALVGNVKGKDQPITYLVATDPAGVLQDIDILAYREPYGGEVAYERWRRQFRGKTADSALVVGRSIRNISGATISVHAVTLGVRRALALLAAWRREGQLP